MFFHTPTKVSPFCSAVFQMIDAMCDAMKCLPSTTKNKALYNDLRGIKTLLIYNNDNDNAISLFRGFKDLIVTHKNLIALIPIIKCFNQILTTLSIIRVTINNSRQNNQELQTLLDEFLASSKTFDSFKEEEATQITNKFMTRFKNRAKTKNLNRNLNPQAGQHKQETRDDDTQVGWYEQSEVGNDDTKTQGGWYEQSEVGNDDTKTQGGWGEPLDSKTQLQQGREKTPATPSQKAQKFLRNLQYRFMSIALELNDHPDSYIDSLGFKSHRCNDQDKAKQDAKKRIKNEAVTPLVNFVSFLTIKSKNLNEQQSDNIKIETIMSSVLSDSYDKFQNNDYLCFCLTVFLIECGELSSQQHNYKPKDFDQNLSLLLDRIQNFSENTDPYSMKNFLQEVQNVTNPSEHFKTECSKLNKNQYNIYNLFYKIGIKLKEPEPLINDYNTMIEKFNRESESKTSTQISDGREDDPLLGKQSSCCSCTLL